MCKKKCSCCKILLDISDFHNNKSSGDGKQSRCKDCAKKFNKVNALFELSCQKCGCQFEHGDFRQHCISCSPRSSYNKLECWTEALKYTTRTQFCDSSNNHYNQARKKGWLDEICSHMIIIHNNWTFEECESSAKLYTTISDFAKAEPAKYSKCVRQGWIPDISIHMTSKFKFYTLDQCIELASKYETRRRFYENERAAYSKCRRNGWLDIVCMNMVEGSYGFSRSDFINACEKNRGVGTIYMLECYDEDEFFYKVGVTSRSVQDRYNNDGSGYSKEMPYYYNILWEVELIAETAWKWELFVKQLTSQYRYLPVLWSSERSYETFIHHETVLNLL